VAFGFEDARSLQGAFAQHSTDADRKNHGFDLWREQSKL
jgi:hypothetical protein